MNPGLRPVLVLAGMLGALGVGLGAFGAHGLKPVLMATGRAELWDTAVFYGLIHTVALAFVPWLRGGRVWVLGLFVGGVVLFSGSLFLYALGGPRWLVGVTPVGGLGLVAGWVALGFSAWRQEGAAGPDGS